MEQDLIKEMEESVLPMPVVRLWNMLNIKTRAVGKKCKYSYAEFSALASDEEETDDKEVVQLAGAFVPVSAHDEHPA